MANEASKPDPMTLGDFRERTRDMPNETPLLMVIDIGKTITDEVRFVYEEVDPKRALVISGVELNKQE